MAEDQPAKTSTKRRVKNPETFRERALRTSEAAGKPDRSSRLKQAGGKLGAGATPVKRAVRFKLPKPLAKAFRLIGKVIFPVYLRNSWRELRQVTWPTWKQSRQLTFAVLIFAALFGAVIALVDYGLDRVFRSILLK